MNEYEKTIADLATENAALRSTNETLECRMHPDTLLILFTIWLVCALNMILDGHWLGAAACLIPIGYNFLKIIGI